MIKAATRFCLSLLLASDSCFTSSFIIPRSSLKLYSLLRANACVKRMLDLAHLGHEVCGFDERGRSVAPRDDDVQRGLFRSDVAQLREDFFHRQHLIAQDIHQLVEDQQNVFTAAQLFYAERPRLARRLTIPLR